MSQPSNHADFAALLVENQGRLFGMLYAHTLNLADTEDLYQQVALVLWEKFDRFEPGSDFRSWSLRVAELTIKNFMRSKRRSRVRFGDDLMDLIFERQGTTDPAQDDSRRDALRHCLPKLAPPERQLLDKVYGRARKVTELRPRIGRHRRFALHVAHPNSTALYNCIERRLAAEGRG